jgi:hypothetical protein
MSYSTGSSAVRIFVSMSLSSRQRRVQRRRLARARRARHDHDAVGLADQAAESLEVVFTQAQTRSRLSSTFDRSSTRITHALAVHRRQDRDAEVDRVAPHRQLDAPVLRQTPLRDVQVRHDLHAARDRRAQVLGRRHHLVQHAVDAVPHLELVLEGLEVDVRRRSLIACSSTRLISLTIWLSSAASSTASRSIIVTSRS